VKRNNIISQFQFPAGKVMAQKYIILYMLGDGYEGEVYLVKERLTGIMKAAKVFYPHRNMNDKVLISYAKKLHRLRTCPIVIHYYTHERMTYMGQTINILISEFVDGEIFSSFLERKKSKRLTPFEGLHFLHALAAGIEDIHLLREYHGDIHPQNIIVQQYGLGFKIKIVDFFSWSMSTKENIKDDVVFMIKVFYDALGARKIYKKLPKEVKYICCGLKKSLITQKFRDAGELRRYIETINWDT
jgi:tRNA A-37 threonylcarbamoyl transferase component Bud32